MTTTRVTAGLLDPKMLLTSLPDAVMGPLAGGR